MSTFSFPPLYFIGVAASIDANEFSPIVIPIPPPPPPSNKPLCYNAFITLHNIYPLCKQDLFFQNAGAEGEEEGEEEEEDEEEEEEEEAGLPDVIF